MVSEPPIRKVSVTSVDRDASSRADDPSASAMGGIQPRVGQSDWRFRRMEEDVQVWRAQVTEKLHVLTEERRTARQAVTDRDFWAR